MTILKTNEISSMCNQLADKIPNVLQKLNIDYVEYENRFSFPCPIHGGDNPEGCCIFKDGETVVGNWKCWTAGCEEDFAQNIFGFVRGCLSFEKGEQATLNETYDFCESIAGKPGSDDLVDYVPSKESRLLDLFLKSSVKSVSSMSREEIRSRLDIPAKYYINRGFCPETLDTFDVGTCNAPNQAMYKRAVVPIYDYNYNYVGCVGRATNDDWTPKWLHSKGFKKEHLYGLNIALPYVKESKSIFLLEGQGDVWRMHEAGYKNSVSIFGASLSEEQLIILEEIGVLNLIILTDNDEAGNKAASQIIKKCGRRFNYFRPHISQKDPGDMPIEKLKHELNSQL